jgi:hypothetical protein
MRDLADDLATDGADGTGKYSNDALVDGLIREFLARKGMQDCLREFDAARPRTAESISSGKELLKALRLSRAFKEDRDRRKRSGSCEPHTALNTLVGVVSTLAAQRRG